MIEILVALIGLGGTVWASTIGYFLYDRKRLKREHASELEKATSLMKERQLFHDQVMSPFYPVKNWTRFVQRVKDISAGTDIDRILILVAVNGHRKPTHASCVWDYRETGEDFSYIDVPLDDDYIFRLNNTESQGRIRFKTVDDGSKISRFYLTEGVTEAIWAMIGKRVNHSTGQIAYKYISVATHEPGGFSNPAEIERLTDTLVAEFRPMLPTAGFGPA